MIICVVTHHKHIKYDNSINQHAPVFMLSKLVFTTSLKNFVYLATNEGHHVKMALGLRKYNIHSNKKSTSHSIKIDFSMLDSSMLYEI